MMIENECTEFCFVPLTKSDGITMVLGSLFYEFLIAKYTLLF